MFEPTMPWRKNTFWTSLLFINITISLCVVSVCIADDRPLLLPPDNLHVNLHDGFTTTIPVLNKYPIGLIDVVRLTLAKNPDIQTSKKQTDIGYGALQQVSGGFDSKLALTLGSSVKNQPLNQRVRNSLSARSLSELRTYSTNSNLTLSKSLRNGIVVSTSLDVTRTTGSANDFNNLFLNPPSQSIGSVDFNIIMPILKGGGDSAVAEESSARLDWEASIQDLRFTISQSILESVSAYWALVAARKVLDINRESENYASQLVAKIQILTDADERPASDINLAKVSLLGKTASRITAEQALLDARFALGQIIGLPYQQINSLEAANGFPSIDTNTSSVTGRLARLIELGMSHRADRSATQLRQEAARIRSAAAQINLKPELNIILNAGYAGLAEGASTVAISESLVKNNTSVNAGVFITYEWQFGNNQAQGQFQQQSSAYYLTKINSATVERSISVGIESALSNVKRSSLQLKTYENAVELYRVTKGNEETRYKMGVSTILDVVTIEDQLINARLTNINYQLGYLNALARLNFETGTLLAEDPSGQSIRLDQLVSLPKLN